MDFSSILTLVASWPADLMAIGGVFILSTLDSLKFGTNRSAALVFSLLISMLLYASLQSTFLLSMVVTKASTPLLQASIFLGLFAIVFVLTYKVITTLELGGGGLLLGILTGLAVVIVLIVTWLQVPALQNLHPISDVIKMIFAESYRLWWILVALFMLAFVRS